MRVLITASTFPARLDDGAPRFVYDLAASLAKHAEINVLVPDSPHAQLRDSWDNVEIRRFSYFFPRSLQRLTPSRGRGMRENIRDSWLAKMQIPFFFASQTRAIRRIIRREHIDVINAHWLIPQGLTTVRALRGMDSIKLVLHIHAGDVYFLRRLPYGRKIARYVVRRCNSILAAGSHVRDTLNELVGWDVKAQLQPMGVHSEAFGLNDWSDVGVNEFSEKFPGGFVLFIGRLVEKKGTIYLVRAMQKIAREFPGMGLVIVGHGSERPNLDEEVQRLGLQEQIHFAGSMPHAEIIRLLHKCRAVAVPSIIDDNGETEGMPTVVIEAMATGAPVVGSAIAGIPDVIHDGKNGWLCREKDSDDLAEKLSIALRAPKDTPVIKAAKRTAENHDWRQVALNYMNYLTRAIREPHLAR